jgi:tetratricopeptide (TPR) repeat protein
MLRARFAAFIALADCKGIMDQFTAHLDRGWELLARNDPHGAEESARSALEIDARSPEAYNLLGYCAALNGCAEEAIEAYEHAIELDDTYFEAILNAAEVMIHPMQDYRKAMALCDQALELVETDEELLDVMLLKFDALLGESEDNVEQAHQLLKQLPKHPYDNPIHTFLVGRAWFEVGEVDLARPLLELAIRQDANHAEAWYYLSMVYDAQEDLEQAIDAFIKVRELDLQSPPPLSALPREQFIKLVRKVVASLDAVLGSYLRPAQILVTDVPGLELVADGLDPRQPILFDGLYLPESPNVPCKRVFFYQRNIERLAGHADLVEEQIHQALEQEITATFLESELVSEHELN